MALNGNYLTFGSHEAQLKPDDLITLLAVQSGGSSTTTAEERNTIVELQFGRQHCDKTFKDDSPLNRQVAALPQLPQTSASCDSPRTPAPLAIIECAPDRAA